MVCVAWLEISHSDDPGSETKTYFTFPRENVHKKLPVLGSVAEAW
jgi:hypothetical protein